MKTRKEFLLASVLLTSLASACSSKNRSAVASSPAADQEPTAFDSNRFNQIIASNAAHRHCFAIARLGTGEGLYAMNNTYTTYEEALNVTLDKVLLAGVLYNGAAITIAFDDDVWNDVLIPALPHISPALRADFSGVRITLGNPFLYRPPDSSGKDASVESLVERGAAFFVCDNATHQLAEIVASALRLPAQNVYQELATSLVPGASLVPTGVWAVQAFQEAHFTYLQATL
jgi:intracellular sulfur oxidation DsrE/DsrF family protein